MQVVEEGGVVRWWREDSDEAELLCEECSVWGDNSKDTNFIQNMEIPKRKQVSLSQNSIDHFPGFFI